MFGYVDDYYYYYYHQVTDSVRLLVRLAVWI